MLGVKALYLVVSYLQKVSTGFLKAWPHTVDLGDNGRNPMTWSHH